VVYPDYADGEEADHVCGVRRLAFKQRIRQTSGLDLRNFQFQYEEGCGDGVFAIAEGLGAASARCASRFTWLLLSYTTKCARCYSGTTIATPAKRLGFSTISPLSTELPRRGLLREH
jgi:hypothetical protein